jgi:hypothetical protein
MTSCFFINLIHVSPLIISIKNWFQLTIDFYGKYGITYQTEFWNNDKKRINALKINTDSNFFNQFEM